MPTAGHRLPRCRHGPGPEAFSNLAQGFNPEGSKRLIQTQNDKHVSGIDVTASADKSVSVAMIGASEAERAVVQACWDEAFDAALGYLEANALLCRVPVPLPEPVNDS